jgi:hypothetical protein
MRSLQSDVEQRGTRIFELVDKHPERLFSKAGFYQRLTALSMHDEPVDKRSRPAVECFRNGSPIYCRTKFR